MVNIKQNLPPLNPEAKQKLISIADSYTKSHKENVLTYLVRGEITIDEMPLLDNEPAVKEWLVRQYQEWLHRPDPKEQADWSRIAGMLPVGGAPYIDNAPLLKNLLEQYISAYKTTKPEGNHLDEAMLHLDKIREEQEKADWDKVDHFSYVSLINYYNTHMGTPFFRELDERLWALANRTPVDVELIRQFMKDMPNSAYKSEAERIEKGFSDWEKVKYSGDPLKVHQYIMDHPESFFVKEAISLREKLKDGYLDDFKKEMEKKSLEDYENIIHAGLFTADDFQEAGIITENSLKKLREKGTVSATYPNIDSTVFECPQNHTDVYFFGIPSTGKTCILMGLLNSEFFNWDSVKYGGKIGQKLQQMCDMGLPPATRTANKEMLLINGQINDSSDGIVHPVNIIDMAGEDFATRLADAPEAKLAFKDMGKGIPELLSNDNDKVFFFTIDPTDEFAKIHVKDETGNYVPIKISQKLTLKAFIDILKDKNNESIMKKVKAIHIIATKADCLSKERKERGNRAKEIISSNYKQSMKSLFDLCDKNKFDINISSNNEPLIFDFSLGNFYMGGVFEYDSTDSDKLLKRIANISAGKRKNKSKWEKMREWWTKY